MATASPAAALCSGATVQQEFREADIVVHVLVVAEVSAWDDDPSAAFIARWGDGGPSVLYGLRVMETFKGVPGPRVNLFQERNSGAFYLRPDTEYLLFLNYIRPSPSRPSAARGAMYVRYACGQSKRWDEVRAGDLNTVRRLSDRD